MTDMPDARLHRLPLVQHRLDVGPQSPTHALCRSACEHPATDHDSTGCRAYGDFDACSCPGYEVDAMDLV